MSKGQAIQNFQKQLKNKLQYKASSKISPDSFLYKSFKFFDLYNNGYLNRSDFFKAIAKCGVVVDTHDVESVYNYYDTHHDGNIYYKQFIQNLLFAQTEMSSSQISQRNQSTLQQKQRPDIQQSRKSNRPDNNIFASSQINPLKQSKIDRIYNQLQTYTEVVNAIKKNLRQKGISSLLNLAVDLKSTDNARTHKISKDKLKWKLNYLSQKAIQIIINQFSNDHSNQINYAELIYSLKGQLEQNQQAIIEKAFNYLDVNNEKQILIQRLISHFSYSTYKQQFCQSVNAYSIFQGIDDGVFTDQDFIDFFGFISFSFSDPTQFITFVQRAYFNEDARSQHSQKSNRSRQFKHQNIIKNQSQIRQTKLPDFRKNKQQPLHSNEQRNLNSPKKDNFMNSSNIKQLQNSADKKSVSRKSQQLDKKSSTTSMYVKQVQMIILRIRKRLSSKGTKGFLVFEKALRQVDADQDGLINIDQFKKVVKDLKIDITNSQTHLLFDVFDPDSTNLISINELLHTLKGKIPQKRSELFQRVWQTVKVSDQHTTFNQIRHSVNFRGHPDIQTGRKHDDQIYKQIQQTILLIQQLNQTPRSQNITKNQFQQYFENLSLTTGQDLLFESTLQNFWKMQSKLNINELYAGSRKIFDSSAKSYLMDHHRYAVKGGTISSNAPFGTSNQPTNYFTEHGKL